MKPICFFAASMLIFCSCNTELKQEADAHTNINGKENLVLSRSNYKDQLYGFWLGQNIANWTGLVTEMDKIGAIGEIKTGAFYTRADWGQADQANIWDAGKPSDLSPTIDFVFRDTNEIWGADDDTDIEYMYQHLMLANQTSVLTAEQIREGWLNHIRAEEENYLWVSNQKAFDLMQQGVLPPLTGDPENNEHYEMIDAQLTTEIFGLFAPGSPGIAMRLATLPIQTTARAEAEEISGFYVYMHALASLKKGLVMKDRLNWMADEARTTLSDSLYPAKMYDYTKGLYQSGIPWEAARDSIYIRYQLNEQDGYDITSKHLYCNGCFAAGINYAASLVSLFYGEGDLKNTIKIGALAGWDSDNPTATWGGLIGFMLGKEGVEKAFGRTFSDRFNIHRTRQNFPNDGLDNFTNMAEKGLLICDRVIQDEIGGIVDLEEDTWTIPIH